MTGIGYRNFEAHSVEIKKRHKIKPDHFRGHAHNNVLEIWAGVGIIGAAFYLLFFLAWAYEMFKRKDVLGHLVFTFIVSFSVSGLFQLTWADGPITFLVMGIYALSLAVGPMALSERRLYFKSREHL